jgi:rhomboid family GlyGly-CTERM serine protease
MKAFRTASLLFALPAAFAGLAPAACLYDRIVILQGEWWRLLTGHWVHFSTSHLWWNLTVLLTAGTWLERLRPGLLVPYALVGAPVAGLGLLAFAPGMGVYGGLSGLATGVVALLALVQLRTQRTERVWWLAVLALTAGKVALDAFAPTPLFSRFGSDPVQVSALAHVLGALLALPVFHLHRRHARPALPGSMGSIRFID